MPGIRWVELEGDQVGLLPGGLTIAVVRLPERGWRAVFGKAWLEVLGSREEDGRAAAAALARRVLTECLAALDRS